MNQCDGCQRGLPVHNGIHMGECEMFVCQRDRYTLELEPMAEDKWHDESKRKPVKPPFTSGT